MNYKEIFDKYKTGIHIDMNDIIDDCHMSLVDYNNQFLINISTDLRNKFGEQFQQILINYNFDLYANPDFIEQETKSYIEIIKNYLFTLHLNSTLIEKEVTRKVKIW